MIPNNLAISNSANTAPIFYQDQQKGTLAGGTAEPQNATSQVVPPPPGTRSVNLSAIPEYLRKLPQWVLWTWEYDEKSKRWVKVPKQPNSRKAQSNNPKTWSTFDQVSRAYTSGGFSGIGLCLAAGDGLQCIDLDHCFDEHDRLKTWAQEIVSRFPDSFIESSPRDGLHIWLLAEPLMKPPRKKEWSENGNKQAVEVFDYNSPRYVTVTGALWQDGAIKDGQIAVNMVCEEYGLGEFAKKKEQAIERDIVYSGVALDVEISKLRDAAPFLARFMENRDNWVKCCFAIKRAGMSFEIFHELCQTWPEYESEDDCRTLWNGADTHTGRDTIARLESLYNIAQKAGWEPPSKIGLPPVVEQRWANVDVPKRFILDANGLHGWVYKKGGEPDYLDRICAPIAVTSRTSGINGEARSGLILEFLTLQNNVES
ncbi:MAG: PriCT-2 domain-containing protein, partial [Cyanobacteria bacterium]|nr:PriCT-2 domain-containing protein [Cyanobacteriota bacterium]